jgi:branched-chain amino acid transport system permease protein
MAAGREEGAGPEGRGLRGPMASFAIERFGIVVPPLALVAAVFVLVSFFADTSIRVEATVMLINLVLVVGLYAFVGNTGIVSFGHMSFMGVGAYVAGLTTMSVGLKQITLPDLPGILSTASLSSVEALLIGGLVACFVAAIVAIPIMRLSGLAAGIATLALLQIAEIVASNWETVTGGPGGLTSIPRSTTLESAFVCAMVAIFIAFLFQESRSGLRLRAAREDESAARAVGVRIVRDRTIAFVVSAFIVGLGGGMYVQYFGLFSPEDFYISITVLTLAMLIVGGIRTLTGAVLGTVVISVAVYLLNEAESTTNVSSLSDIGLAVAMLAILILRPNGLIGRDFPLPWRRRNGDGAGELPSAGAGTESPATKPPAAPGPVEAG